MNAEAGFQLADIQGIIRRRAKVVAGVSLLLSLAAYWVAMALPNEYESYATVLVEPQAVDPDLVAAGVAQADLNRRLHIMAAQILSRPRLSRIIDELGLYEEESNYLVRDEIVNMMREAVMVEPVMPEMEEAQASFRREFVIDQFRIRFRDDDATVARDVAQRLANDFIEEHISTRVRTSQKSVEFVEAELNRLSKEIREVEKRVAEFKSANTGRLPEDMPANVRFMERMSMQMGSVRREVAAARSDEAFYRSQSATAREMGSGLDYGRQDTPQGRVRALELALTDFESRGFTPKHPDVVKTKQELAQLKATIQARMDDEDAPPSFAAQSSDAEAERARLRLAGAEEEVSRIEVQMEEVARMMGGAPQVAEALDGMERDYMHLFDNFQDFSNKRLEATVQADLERRQLGEQFRVLESAFLAPEPTSPNRPVIVIIGMFFGLALGAGVGIVLEAADGSVHTVHQLQSSFDLPVLVAIPRIWLESDRMTQRRARIRTTFATLAVVAFALVGGAANYWWVNGGGGGKTVESESRTGSDTGRTGGE